MIRAIASSPKHNCYSVVFYAIDAEGHADRSQPWIELPVSSLDHAFAVAAAFNNPSAAKSVQDAVKTDALFRDLDKTITQERQL